MTDPAYLPLLTEALAKAIPIDKDAGGDARAAGSAIARAMLDAWQPADALEAAAAARAIAAHLAAMDAFARAARPGISDETAIRLRASAIAAGRVFDTLRRESRRQRQPAEAESQPRTRSSATRVRGHAEPRPAMSVLSDLVTKASQGSAWRSESALVPIRPTVPVPA